MNDDDVRRKRYQVSLDGFGKRAPEPTAKQRIRDGKGFRTARRRMKNAQWRFRRDQRKEIYAWMAEAGGRKPDCVVTDPRGHVRVGVWKNTINDGNVISYHAQCTFLYWSYKQKRLCAKFTINIREMFLLAKCLHKAIEWCCRDAGVAYPTELFEHCQVGFEVRYGRFVNDRVVVSSEEEIKRVVAASLGEDPNDRPQKYAMPDLMEQLRDRRTDDIESELLESWEHQGDAPGAVEGGKKKDGGSE